MHRLTVAAAAAGFVFSVWLANYLVDTYGPIRVWPTDLLAPAGVYVVGFAFLLRDTVQRFAGVMLALVCVAVGTALSVLVSAHLALASGVAFATSELVGLVVFLLLRGQTGGRGPLALAVIAASLCAAAVDSYVFLEIAFGNLGFFWGQFIAKTSVLALAVPFVLLARQRWPVTHERPA